MAPVLVPGKSSGRAESRGYLGKPYYLLADNAGKYKYSYYHRHRTADEQTPASPGAGSGVPQQTDPESENSGYDADYSGGCHVTSCTIDSL
jgi:hypothetical protein